MYRIAMDDPRAEIAAGGYATFNEDDFNPAPANPATGAPATGPADRMMKQGYRGWSYSENIAMSASPTQAHLMWIHSSGHHRNILSGWTDLGSGVGGRNFTQNFGSGGGARPEIYADTKIRGREGSGRGGRGRRRGQ